MPTFQTRSVTLDSLANYRSSEDTYAALAKVRLPLEQLVIRR